MGQWAKTDADLGKESDTVLLYTKSDASEWEEQCQSLSEGSWNPVLYMQ